MQKHIDKIRDWRKVTGVLLFCIILSASLFGCIGNTEQAKESLTYESMHEVEGFSPEETNTNEPHTPINDFGYDTHSDTIARWEEWIETVELLSSLSDSDDSFERAIANTLIPFMDAHYTMSMSYPNITPGNEHRFFSYVMRGINSGAFDSPLFEVSATSEGFIFIPEFWDEDIFAHIIPREIWDMVMLIHLSNPFFDDFRLIEQGVLSQDGIYYTLHPLELGGIVTPVVGEISTLTNSNGMTNVRIDMYGFPDIEPFMCIYFTLMPTEHNFFQIVEVLSHQGALWDESVRGTLNQNH